MYPILKKIKEAVVQAAKETKSLPTYRISSIEFLNAHTPVFVIQLVGKSAWIKLSDDKIINDKHIYNHLSIHEKNLIHEITFLFDKKNKQKKNNLTVLNFNKNKIKTITIDEASGKIYFSITQQKNNQENVLTLLASDIFNEKSIFNSICTNDRIQIAYYAGMQEILDENKQLLN